MKYIDTHAHYGHKRFKMPTDRLMLEMKKYTDKIIQVGTNTRSNQQTLELIAQYDYLYGMIGYFPTDVWELDESFNQKAEENYEFFIQSLQDKKIVGIGEIGLDYNWNKVGNVSFGEDAHNLQKKWFRHQLDMAKQFKLPVSIHSRDAESPTLAIFAEYESIDGVIHCFSYGRSAAQKALDKGLYLGIGGTSTYPTNQELREVIKYAPINRLLLETDAPYLSPQQVRREVNTSANIKYVIENIAQIKNLTCEDVIEQTNINAYELFKKMK